MLLRPRVSGLCQRQGRNLFIVLGHSHSAFGRKTGCLVVQSKQAREYSGDEIYALEVVAMVLAEMAELGAFVGEETGLKALHQQPVMFRGSVARGAQPKEVFGCMNPRCRHQSGGRG